MKNDFGMLVDFLRGELDSGSAAQVRARLENDVDYFDLFQRLKRAYAVLRSLPTVRPAAADVIEFDSQDFICVVRREFEARDWLTLLPWIDGHEEFLRTLRTEFVVRALAGSIPQLHPTTSFLQALRAQFAARTRIAALPQVSARAQWVGALREEFAVRAKLATLPMLEPRPAFVTALRAELAGHAKATSLPQIAVRPGFRRRLQVALFEAAEKEKTFAPEPALPQVLPEDPFRRRLFKTILLSTRRRVRDVPTRVDPKEYQWGRELGRGLKRSQASMAFTMSMHALAVVIMLFIFARPDITGQTATSVSLGHGQAIAAAELPGNRPEEPRLSGPDGDTVGRFEDDRVTDDDRMDLSAPDAPPPELDDFFVREDDVPPTQTLATESEGVQLPRENVPAFFRLRTMDRARKAQYLGREDLFDVLDAALRYLQVFQTHEGYWWVVGVPPEVQPRSWDLQEVQKIEMTSAALLAYLGDGHSSEYSPIGYAGNVDRGIKWLLEMQREDGQIGPLHLANVQIHAMATLALAEEYGLTRAHRLRTPLKLACRWLCNVQAQSVLDWEESSDGFPFKADELGRASLTTSVWAYMALATARHVKVPPIDLPQERIDAFMRWFETAPRHVDLLKDQPEILARGNLLPTAAGASLCLFAQEEGSDARFDSRQKEYLKRVVGESPDLKQGSSKDNGDARYLFFGSLAMALHQQKGGERAAAWNKDLAETLIATQMPNGGFKPADEYGQIYGNVYATAFAALSIENAYRVNLLTR
jgi:hypothetical protein